MSSTRKPRVILAKPAGTLESWMPKKSAIAWYWFATEAGRRRASFQSRVDIGEPCCFACSFYVDRYDLDWSSGFLAIWENARYLVRCHLVPKSLGGSPDASNMVLLCKHCHDNAPDVNDPNVMLRWVERQKSREPALLAWRRMEVILQECMAMGGSLESVTNAMNSPNWHANVQAALDKASLHWGPSGSQMSIGTWASVILAAVDEATIDDEAAA